MECVVDDSTSGSSTVDWTFNKYHHHGTWDSSLSPGEILWKSVVVVGKFFYMHARTPSFPKRALAWTEPIDTADLTTRSAEQGHGRHQTATAKGAAHYWLLLQNLVWNRKGNPRPQRTLRSKWVHQPFARISNFFRPPSSGRPVKTYGQCLNQDVIGLSGKCGVVVDSEDRCAWLLFKLPARAGWVRNWRK